MTYSQHSKESSGSQHRQQPIKATAQTFSDNRESAAVSSPLQAMMANSPQQQKLKSAAQLMAKSPAQQNLNSAAQSFANKSEPMQRMDDEEPLQGKFETESEPAQLEAAPEAPRPNNTGLPDNLKSGIENLSGMSMDHVRVHYNSDKPAQLQAHAYAQGSEIHVAPGQEQHLPHEAWHVVQQAQGRVRPTMQMKGDVQVNDDVGLEAEADLMGERAVQLMVEKQNERLVPVSEQSKNIGGLGETAQLATTVKNSVQPIQYDDSTGLGVQTVQVGNVMEATLDPKYPRQGSSPGAASGTLYESLRWYYKDGIKGHLLNDNLGGLGVEENLFPISASANHQHLEWESAVKASLITQIHNYNANLPYNNVGYKVKAVNKSTKPNFDDDPKAEIQCEAWYEDSSKKIVSKVYKSPAIESDISGGKKKGGMNDDLDKNGWGGNGSGMRSGMKKVKTILRPVPGVSKRYIDNAGNEYDVS